jgi:hypothetical protein
VVKNAGFMGFHRVPPRFPADLRALARPPLPCAFPALGRRRRSAIDIMFLPIVARRFPRNGPIPASKGARLVNGTRVSILAR